MISARFLKERTDKVAIGLALISQGLYIKIIFLMNGEKL